MYVTAKKVEEEETKFVPIELTLRFDTLKEASKFREMFNHMRVARWVGESIADAIRDKLIDLGVSPNSSTFQEFRSQMSKE